RIVKYRALGEKIIARAEGILDRPVHTEPQLALSTRDIHPRRRAIDPAEYGLVLAGRMGNRKADGDTARDKRESRLDPYLREDVILKFRTDNGIIAQVGRSTPPASAGPFGRRPCSWSHRSFAWCSRDHRRTCGGDRRTRAFGVGYRDSWTGTPGLAGSGSSRSPRSLRAAFQSGRCSPLQGRQGTHLRPARRHAERRARDRPARRRRPSVRSRCSRRPWRTTRYSALRSAATTRMCWA